MRDPFKSESWILRHAESINSKHVTWPKLGNTREYSPIFKTPRVAKKIWRIINTIASIWGKNMLGYLSLDIICSSKLIVFLELRSRKIVRFSEQIMSKDKYPSTFSRQMEAIVSYITVNPNRTVSLSKFSFFKPLHLLIRTYQVTVLLICPLALSWV